MTSSALRKTPPLLDIHKRTPLGHCPRAVIHPPKKLKNTLTLGHSQAPPLGHCPFDVIHIPRGGGGVCDRSRSRTLCIGFQYRDKFKGGVITPVTPPPPDPPLHLRSTSKKGGGSNFRPNVKKPTSWPKRGGGVQTPWTPPPLDPLLHTCNT